MANLQFTIRVKQQWEYKEEAMPTFMNTIWLDSQGQDGWELVTIVRYSAGLCLYLFKRLLVTGEGEKRGIVVSTEDVSGGEN